MKDFLKSPVLYFSVATGFLYSVGWSLLFGKKPVHNGYNAPYKMAFAFGAVLIAVSAALVGLSFGNIQSAIFGVIGATTMFLCLLLHHQSVGHALIGLSLITTIIVSLIGTNYSEISQLLRHPVTRLDNLWHSPYSSLFLFIIGVFSIGYAVSSRKVVHIFGPGTTLISALVAIATCLVYYFDPTRLTLSTGTALALVPIALIKTGHPSYLDNSSASFTNKLISFCIAVASIVCPLLVLIQTTKSEYVGLFVTCSILGGLGLVLLYFFTKRVTVLGPFYHFERRAVVFTTIAVGLIAFEIATRENNAFPTLSLALMQTIMGYFTAFALSSLLLITLEPWQLPTSSAVRAALVDLLSVFLLFSLALFVLIKYSTRTDEIYALVSTFFKRYFSHAALYATVETYFPQVVSSSNFSFLVAAVTCSLFALTSHLQTFFTRSSLVLAPLYSNIYSRGNPRLPAAAITFNVSLSPPEPGATTSNTVSVASLDAVLELLRNKKVAATFFLPGALICSPEGHGIVAKIIADGHEAGLLGLAGPHSISHIVQDMERSVVAFRKILSSLPSARIKKAQSARRQSAAGERTTETNETAGQEQQSLQDLVTNSSNMTLPGASTYREGDVINTSDAMTTPSTLDQLLGSDVDLRQLRWYRPQDASRDIRVLRTATCLGLRVSLWSACPFDWDGNLKQIQERLEKQLLVKEGLEYQEAMDALEKLMQNANRQEKLEYAISYGSTNPSLVYGSIVLLHIGLPAHLMASNAWARETPHPRDTAAVVIDTFVKAGIPTSRLLPLSRLCSSVDGGLEVLKVD